MITALISRLVIVCFGTLYPAYASYKAVRSRDITEYVKWMMYWIVFALFTSVEVFTDVFVSFWFPFYYELKIILVIWLMSPLTRGSSILYKKIIHPTLVKKEQEIDEYLARAKDQGYSAMVEFGSKGVSIATNAIMTTAMKTAPPALHLLLPKNDYQSMQEVIHQHEEPQILTEHIEEPVANENVVRMDAEMILCEQAALIDVNIREECNANTVVTTRDEYKRPRNVKKTKNVKKRVTSLSRSRSRGRNSRKIK